VQLTCPGCGNVAAIPDDRLPPVGARGVCRSCERPFVFDGHCLVDEDATPSHPMDAFEDGEEVVPVVGMAAEAAPRPPAPETVADAFWIRTGAGDQGPYELADLRNMIRAGQLDPAQEIRPPGSDRWMQADEWPELHRYFVIRERAAAARGATAEEDEPQLRCGRHPTTVAEHVCGACGAWHCEACVVRRNVGPIAGVVTCPACQGACRPVERRAKVVPFQQELREVFRFPVKGLGWLAIPVATVIWGMTLPAQFGALYGRVATWILDASLYAYILLIIRKTADGATGMPDLGHIGNWKDDLIFPGLRAIVVSFAVLLPFNLYGLFVLGPTLQAYHISQMDTQAAQGDGSPPWATPAAENDEPSEREQAAQEAYSALGVADEDEEVDAPSGAWTDEEADYEDTSLTASDAFGTGHVGGAHVFLAAVGALAVLAYGVAIWPMLLILVALFNTIMPVLRLDQVLRIIGAVWKDYGPLLLFTSVVLLGMLPLYPFVTRNFGVRMALGQAMPSLFFWIAPPIFFYLVFVLAHAFGRVARQIDRKVDWA